MISKQKLSETFNKARKYEAPFVFIALGADDTEEVVVIPEKSFDEKEAFYLNSDVRITGLSFGTALELNKLI